METKFFKIVEASSNSLASLNGMYENEREPLYFYEDYKAFKQVDNSNTYDVYEVFPQNAMQVDKYLCCCNKAELVYIGRLHDVNVIKYLIDSGVKESDIWDWAVNIIKHLVFAIKKSEFDGFDLIDLITAIPALADWCDLSRLNKFETSSFVIKFPHFIDKVNLSKLNGYDWTDILAKYPHLESYCNWGSLNVPNWQDLLEKQPQFKSKFYEYINIYSLKDYELAVFLKRGIITIDEINVSKLSNETIDTILQFCPDLEGFFKKNN